VLVTFDEPVSAASATEPSNYSIDNGIVVSAATLDSEQLKVTLSTSQHLPGTEYTLSVIGIQDLASNTILPGTEISYSFVPQLVVSGVSAASGVTYQVAESLQVGDLAYVDRSFTYLQIPSELLGASYIQTANDDKLSQGDAFLSFDINQPASVYVLHDDRYTVRPAWLDAFSDTGLEVQINDNLSVFRREYPTGRVTLGGNVSPQNALGYNMYTVLIMPTVTATDPPVPPSGLMAE
jgi:hypothetical protein